MRQNRNLTRWLPAALCGIALAGIANFNSSLYGQVTNLVALTSFEPAVFDENFNLLEPDTMPRYPWAYRYIGGPEGWDPNTPPTLETQYGIPETDPNPTNHCERVYFYTYAYSPMPTGNSYGLGFGGGMNWNRFDPAVVKMSTNRADYIMSFDAKVEGLLPEFNDISIEMQVQMDAPDDTIEPADSNGDADRIIGINKAVNVTSNWTHFEYLLEDANIDGGTPLANLVKYGNLVNSVNYNVNVHMPSDRFGFDWDNYVYIDNIKLQVINDTNPPPPIPPTTPITMLEWNMDDKPMWGAGWGGYNWSANTNLPIFTYNVSAAGYGV
ncbi:MAG TPA: hypothetical protein VNZ22_02070, partial [Bacillota bacterium]|nr:hypothetical protein [Bacillota bacterium]